MLEAPAYLLHRRTMVFVLRQNTNAPKDQLLSTKTQTPFCNQLFRLPVFPFCGGLCSTARPFFSLICRIFDFYSFWYTPYSLAIKKEMLLQLTFPFLTLFEFVQIGISCFQHFPANRWWEISAKPNSRPVSFCSIHSHLLPPTAPIPLTDLFLIIANQRLRSQFSISFRRQCFI